MPLTPARYPSGVSTARAQDFFANFPNENPFQVATYENDFFTYLASDWTVTTTNSGTTALQDSVGGQLILTTGTTSSNFQGNTLSKAGFAVAAGFQAWFLINIRMVDALEPSFVIGMTKGGPSAPTDGVYFTKATATRAVAAVIRASSTSTTIASAATMVDNTWISIGWYYDGRGVPSLSFWSSQNLTSPTAYGNYPPNGGQIITAAGANNPTNTSLANLPVSTTLLAPQFYVITNSANAKTLEVDYLCASCEMSRF